MRRSGRGGARRKTRSESGGGGGALEVVRDDPRERLG